MADLLGWDGEKLVPIPGATVEGDVACVAVCDAVTDNAWAVPVTEAAEGMLRYARRLAPGSPARGEVERQALSLLPPPGNRKRGRRG